MRALAGVLLIALSGYMVVHYDWSMWTIFFGVWIGLVIANNTSIVKINVNTN